MKDQRPKVRKSPQGDTRWKRSAWKRSSATKCSRSSSSRWPAVAPPTWREPCRSVLPHSVPKSFSFLLINLFVSVLLLTGILFTWNSQSSSHKLFSFGAKPVCGTHSPPRRQKPIYTPLKVAPTGRGAEEVWERMSDRGIYVCKAHQTPLRVCLHTWGKCEYKCWFTSIEITSSHKNIVNNWRSQTHESRPLFFSVLVIWNLLFTLAGACMCRKYE